MPHTKSRYMQDLGFSDARIRLSPQQELIAFGTTVLTRTAAGNINYAQAASQTVQYTADMTAAMLRRTGFFEDLQEQFGGLGIPASAEYQGRPDTLGSMSTGQPITPRTAFKIKGYQLNSFDVIYAVGTNPLTAISCQVNLASYVAGSAPVIVNQLASAANGLLVAVATMNVINVAMPSPQSYVISPDQDQWIEVSIQTPAGGTATIWGIDALITFNFN
jgi:hypothetical protein